ncbi:hypothetical protein [Sorangium sp. So ce854]|uniref:hypothetical protein n=1 Tax=Sorangium sp. So ce854 TaxID=3133322 RepID=UPI003F6184F4
MQRRFSAATGDDVEGDPDLRSGRARAYAQIQHCARSGRSHTASSHRQTGLAERCLALNLHLDVERCVARELLAQSDDAAGALALRLPQRGEVGERRDVL